MIRRATGAPLAAYVLHTYDWSESSLIVELFTRERGRVVVAAKGAKRPYSQLRPVLLPLQRLTVTLGRAPSDETSDVYNLRGAEWGGGAPMPRGEALFRGFYLNELLLKLLARQDPHPILFDAYEQTLPSLGRADSPAGLAALRAFEMILLREIGLLPALDVITLNLAPIVSDGSYALSADAGLARVPDASDEPAVSGQTWLAIHRALAAGQMGTLQATCLDALVPLRRQLRDLLHYHLGRATLRSRVAMLDIQRLIDTKPPTS